MKHYGNTFNSWQKDATPVDRVAVWKSAREFYPSGAFLGPDGYSASGLTPHEAGSIVPAGTPVHVDIPGGTPKFGESVTADTVTGLTYEDVMLGTDGCTFTVVTEGEYLADRGGTGVGEDIEKALFGRIKFIHEIEPSEIIGDFTGAIKNGGDVKLSGNVSLTEPIEVTKGANIDLNGYTVKSSTVTPLKFTGGESVLSGGTVKGASGVSACAVSVGDGATLTINGGTYSMGDDENGEGNSCIYSDGGNIVINGGTFSSDGVYNGRHWVLNKKNDTGGKIEVKGGRFKNFDPANPNTDDDESYLAGGYKSVPDGEYYKVVANE